MLEIVAYFLTRDIHELKTLLFALPKIKNYRWEKQVCVLAGILNGYGIDTNKLGWFVLDNASNNDTTLFKLSKTILFDPKKN